MQRHERRFRHDAGRMRGSRGMSGPRGMHVRGSLSEAPRSIARGGIKFAVLDMLKEKSRHGYDIIRAMEEASGGLYSPSPGAIYPTLQALEDEGLVAASTEDGKKVYSITEVGAVFLETHKDKAESHRERWDARWGGGRHGRSDETLRDLHESFHTVKRAVQDGAGDPDKLKEMAEVLRQAASQIEQISGR